MRMMSSLLFVLLLLFESSLACKYKFIHNASELIKFSDEANGKITYSGYTVFLTADIIFDENLSKLFKPINYFSGTFDGQGYLIKNLVMSSSAHTTGLFGTLYGATIKNVVIGSTSSISSSYSNSDNVHVAGLIGACYANNGPCVLENNVNMASVSYSGNNVVVIWMGGIVAGFYVNDNNKHEARIANCANHGNINIYGSSTENMAVGGIVGDNHGNEGGYNHIYNCVNYGEIVCTGTTQFYYVGGLIGYGWGDKISNSVSVGAISSAGYTGGIIGRAFGYNMTINSCYWTSDTKCNYYYGESTEYLRDSGINQVSINSNIANELRNYATTNKWNGWFYNQNNAKITFVEHSGEGFSYSTKLILLPEPARRGYSFLFWCVNSDSTDACNEKYDPTKTAYSSATTFYAQWVANKCTVTFDVNGGDNLPVNDRNISTLFDQEMGKLPEPSKRGYTLTGWFTTLNELVTNKSLVNDVCNCSLYARWTPNSYDVILDVNKGVELDNNRTTVTFDSTYCELPVPERSGFNFIGWYTKDNENITSTTIVNITNEQVLYAKWTAKNFTVSLNTNGGELPEGEKEVEVISNRAYESLKTPTRDGYTFTGWYTMDGGLITNDTTTTVIITKDQTLYAEWVPNNYTVMFDVNGGDELDEDEDNNKTVTFNVSYGKLPEPSREGYTFVGWFTDVNELVTDETKVNISHDHVLYAEWTPSNYTVSFVMNGGDEVENITVAFNNSYGRLPKPTREGYELLWWYIEGTNDIVDNKTIVKIASNHTLCAVWNKNTVIFDVNGGDELDDYEKEKEVIYGEVYDTLPTPNKTGYRFDGWFTNDGEEITNDTKVTITSNQVLHANWTVNTYVISFDVNEGDELPEDKKNITVTYGSKYEPLPAPSRTGYEFNGWYTEDNKLVTSETKVAITSNQIFHANWTANMYVISFDVNGGDELPEDKKNITVIFDGEYGTLSEPTRAGYTFSGWYNSDNEKIASDTTVSIITNKVLHAEWTANNYTIKLIVDDGVELSTMEFTVTYDGTYDLLPTPSRTGYEFNGWYTKDNKLITSEMKVTYACNYTLHANWTANTYVISFDVNGGDELSEDKKNITVIFGGEYGTLPEPTRTGYEFNGWYTEDNKFITSEMKVAVADNQILYAHWTEIVTSQTNPPSKYVEIVFGKGDMTEEEIREILSKLIKEHFEVIEIDRGKTGETTAIIKFDDVESAEKFLVALNEASGGSRYFIRSANFVSRVDVSLSAPFNPFILRCSFFI